MEKRKILYHIEDGEFEVLKPEKYNKNKYNLHGKRYDKRGIRSYIITIMRENNNDCIFETDISDPEAMEWIKEAINFKWREVKNKLYKKPRVRTLFD